VIYTRNGERLGDTLPSQVEALFTRAVVVAIANHLGIDIEDIHNQAKG
jgi:hypothetical protein